ncbi:hypothetical protein [Novosphingobium sp. KN65.2]|uniref:hypothetical protein n=1 Tax=Novosphingobium sp. KN65.2 TaxID=1478134 RepID=UPI0005E6CBD6|nr:hypothetical protein [Novosphingobium sp. KN65.2]CDO38300.1 hypothetical protein SPHV1_550017 [Novosphingobium sp. KN65.2]
MHFTDARNLLLGLAASQQVKDSPLVVSMLGDARCIDFGNTKGASVLPYDGALIDDKILSECSFGMAVDAILSAMSEGEFADEEGEPFDVAITVSRSNGGVGLSAIIRFQTMHQFMQWDFNASNPDFEGLDSEAANRLARERISSPESAHFEQTTRIGKMMLETLANFIAGANE